MIGLRAIETAFKGYRFRSRLEARWAVFFDSLGIPWEYEKEGYDLDGVWYLPDFWLPKQQMWVEVKGAQPNIVDDEGLRKAEVLAAHSGKLVLVVCGSIGEHEMHTYGPFPISPLSVGDQREALAKMNWGRGDSYATDDWGAQIHCPFCGYEYVHIGEVAEKVVDDYTAWQGRGEALRVGFWCEAGDHWTVRYGFHKGFTFVAIENAWEEVRDLLLWLASGDASRCENALDAARSARFEFGEHGARNGN